MTLQEFLNIWNKLNIEYDRYRDVMEFYTKDGKWLGYDPKIIKDADNIEYYGCEISFEDEEIKVYVKYNK